MDFNRAQQILNSDQTFNVMYNGSPVWIESLNQDDKSALVKSLNDEGNIQQVPVNKLIES